MLELRYIIYFGALLLLATPKTEPVLERYEERIIQIDNDPDSSILSIIEPYKEGNDSIMNETLCYSDITMGKGNPESLLGNFVTDLCLEITKEKADICIMNTGGLRAVLPEGIITRGKIYELMPFDNELVILELNKQEFRELLIYLKERNGEPFSGMKLTILQNDSINIQFNNKEIKKENRIRILTSDYLANGGDRMDFFIDKKQYPIGVKVRDAIINYCNSKDTITSKLDARFKYE